MDYVVAGFGIGAVLALIGFALWELFGNAEAPGTNWLGRAAIGLMLGSLVIWAVTGVSLISHVNDSTGSNLVLLTSLVTLAAIAIGTFWYWRAERMLADSRPHPANASVPRAAAPAVAASLAGEDVELTAWDSWPDRDAADQSKTTSDGPESEPLPSFEPEVAVEAALAPEIEIVPDETETVTNDVVDAVPEGAAPIVPAADAGSPDSELPFNLRQFRPIVLAEPLEPLVLEEGLLAEAVDPAPPEVVVDEEALVDAVEVVDTARVAELEAPVLQDEEQDQPLAGDIDGSVVAFESSLLLDVDGSLAEEGGYRSPLLSDLGSDQLEGVGLAKWRPDARLTGQEDEESPLPTNTNLRS